MKFYGWKNELFAYKAALKYYRKLRYKEEERKKLEWLDKYGKKIKAFHNIHKGEDCFIIGNGPSLNRIEIEKLNEFYNFGMNKIYLLFDYKNLDIDYYVSVNKLVIEQSIKQIREFEIPVFLNHGNSRNIESKKNIIKLETGGLNGVFQHDLTSFIPEGYTVTYVAMQIAYYMGFKNVYLVGMDHNFDQIGKPNEEQTLKEEDNNHFDPRYFKDQKWHLADLEGSELHYRIADFVFKRDGRNIYNATVGGKLEIFKRIDFEKAISQAKRK